MKIQFLLLKTHPMHLHYAFPMKLELEQVMACALHRRDIQDLSHATELKSEIYSTLIRSLNFEQVHIQLLLTTSNQSDPPHL